jgi:hypothetical protein
MIIGRVISSLSSTLGRVTGQENPVCTVGKAGEPSLEPAGVESLLPRGVVLVEPLVDP